ncbi:MAG: DivIVA domain-containing protein [Nitrospirales bacterium]|nr:DivIVA domain-containing protein [Nitrospira sp.]MDR4500456.1 DivIVA domain-containing protein [Nitrospirales bacterium]
MKITPLDIQHKVFDAQFRGYEKRQVDQFLEEVAETVENLTRENTVLKEKVASKEEELGNLKKTENTLTSTLLSTQTFVEQLKRGAERDAELIVKEAELKAEEILAQSRSDLMELRRMIADLRRQRALVLERLRSTLGAFHRLIEVEENADPIPDVVEETTFTADQESLPEV